MTPALASAQQGLAGAAKRFGAASTAVVAVSAAETRAVAAAETAQAVAAPAGGQGGSLDAGGNGQGSGQPGGFLLPDGLLTLLQEAGVPQARGRFGSAPSLEQSTVDSLLAQRAFEANVRSFQAADRQLGDTLNLLA